MPKRIRLNDSGQSIAKKELERHYYKIEYFAEKHNFLLSNVKDTLNGNFVNEEIFNKIYKELNIKLYPEFDFEYYIDKHIEVQKTKKRSETQIERSIEFPTEYWEAGTSILSYFSRILSVKYPKKKIKVKIEQENLTLRMVIDTLNGERKLIEKTLDEYAMIVMGKLEPESFLSDPLEVMRLNQKLEFAHLELKQTRQLLAYTKNNNQQRIQFLEKQFDSLSRIIEKGLQSRNSSLETISKTIEHKKIIYNLNNPKFDGGITTDIEIQAGDNELTGDTYNQSGNIGIGHMSGGEIEDGAKVAGVINETEEQDLAQAAQEIQNLLKQLEQTNPTATEEQQIKHINDETTPKFKRKAFAVLKAAGNTAIDEFLENPYAKVGKAAIMGWVDA